MSALVLDLEALFDTPPRYANTGGPRSRTRQEQISATLLGNNDGLIHCPRTIRLGLRFENTHPVSCLESLLDEEGFKSPEDLRFEFALPAGRWICRVWNTDVKRILVSRAPRRRVLKQALMLGLCTAQVLDPDRPVLWTETSVTRTLELFDPAGFYA
jgi:hypothetical protein